MENIFGIAGLSFEGRERTEVYNFLKIRRFKNILRKSKK